MVTSTPFTIKKALSIICFITFSTIILAQEKYKIKFENGQSKDVVIEYDDPSRLPKFQVEFNPMSFAVLKDASLTFHLKPSYRITDWIRVEGRLVMPYGRKVDGNIHQNLKDEKDIKFFWTGLLKR